MTEPTPPGLSQQAELKTQPDAAKDAAQGAADTAAADALEAAASQRMMLPLCRSGRISSAGIGAAK